MQEAFRAEIGEAVRSAAPILIFMPQISTHPLIGHRFDRADGGNLQLELVDDWLKLEARVGPASMITRLGELRVELDFELPQTILTACVGRMIEEIVDHGARRGRGWRIVAAEEGTALSDQTLVVVTGSVEYRMLRAR